MSEKEERSPSSVPPSSDPAAGDGRAAARVMRAIRPSELTASPEDLAAISIRAAAMPALERSSHDGGEAPPLVLGEDVWDPMQSYATRDSTVPPSVTQRPAQRPPPAPEDSPPSVEPRDPRDRVGDVVSGRYELRKLLGEGGMAAVYEAFDRSRAKKVAMKVMHGNYAGSAEMVARFRREARVAAAVKNPHIVRILDVGKAEGVGLYLVMELLEGEDVSAVLGRSGAIPWKPACALAAQAASGLAAAHASGVVHRDIKPANLFLGRGERGQVRLTVVDFGVAKPEDDGPPEGLTRVGTVVGTPQYMAPEQARAERNLGPRVDVYSLGATLFEMIAGRPAFAERETIHQTLYDVATLPPPRLSSVKKDVPPEVDALLADMMCQDPALRLGDMELVLQRLAAQGCLPDAEVHPGDLTAGVAEDPRKRTTARTRLASARAEARAKTTTPRKTRSAPARRTGSVLPWLLVVAVAALIAGGIVFLR